MILDINEKPILKSYTHDADFMAIVTASHLKDGQDAIIRGWNWNFKGANSSQYHVQENYCKLKQWKEDDLLNLTLIEPENEDKKNVVLYQNVSGTGNFTVCVEDFKENDHLTQNGIIITMDSLDEPKVYLKFAFLPMGTVLVCACDGTNPKEEAFYDVVHNSKWLRIEVLEDGIKCCCSVDGIEWNDVIRIPFVIHMLSYHIGYYLEPRKSSFKDWFFTNYIQLNCSSELVDYLDVPLNYYSGIHKEFYYNQRNPWISQNIVNWPMISDHISIIELIKKLINNRYYIHMRLDEYYINNRSAYRKEHFLHGNMIYGYDDETKMLYMTGFDEAKKYSVTKVSYADFIEAFNHIPDTSRSMFTMRKLFPSFPFVMKKDVVKKYLEEYLLGINSSYRDDILGNEWDRVFGMKIYDVILEKIEKLLDVRIMFLYCEHKEIMKMRVDYFLEKGFLNQEQYEEVSGIANRLYELAKRIVNMNLKYIFRQDNRMLDRIKLSIQNAKEMDEALIRRLLMYI